MNASHTLPFPEGIPATGTRTEQALLQKIADALDGEERAEALWQIMFFYWSHVERNDLAMALLNLMIQESSSAERTAKYYLTLGQIVEQEKQWDLALQHYMSGLAVSPHNQVTAYYLNNYAGYCLNKLGRFQQSEEYCLCAIEIDPERHLAYKNLGVALEGTGDHYGAWSAWNEARRCNPADHAVFLLAEKVEKEHQYIRRVKGLFPNLLSSGLKRTEVMAQKPTAQFVEL
jgi:tetratricopeptide (TPR) repeat protein